MALRPHLAAVILQHVDPAFGRRRLELLADIAAHADPNDPGGWIAYGHRDVRDAGRSAEQAKYDRTALRQLVDHYRILEQLGGGGRGRPGRYRFRPLSLKNWRHLRWLTPKAELMRRWAPATHARKMRVSPGQSCAEMRESPGQNFAPRSVTRGFASPAAHDRRGAARPSRRLVDRDGSEQGERATRYPQAAHRGTDFDAPHREKAARSTSSGTRVPSSSSQGSKGGDQGEAQGARARVVAAILARCTLGDGRPAWGIGGAPAEQLDALVATYPAAELVAAVERIGAGPIGVPEMVRQLGDHAAAGFPTATAGPVVSVRRDYERVRLDCPACGGGGVRELDDGTAVRCDHEHQAAG